MGCSAVAVRAGGRRETAARSAPVFSRHQQLLGAGHLPLQRPGLARNFGDSGRHGPGQRLGAAPRFGGAFGRDPPIVGGREGPDPAVQCPRQRPAGCGTGARVSAGESTPVPPLRPDLPITPSPAKCCAVPDSDKLSSDGSSSRSPTSGTCGDAEAEWMRGPPGAGVWGPQGGPHLVRGLPQVSHDAVAGRAAEPGFFGVGGDPPEVTKLPLVLQAGLVGDILPVHPEGRQRSGGHPTLTPTPRGPRRELTCPAAAA